MMNGGNMKTIKRRRKENKTDYLKRIKLLKSKIPRIVFRKTNRYLVSQYVVSEAAQDVIKFGINSKHLLKYGWPEKINLNSLPAAYFLGFLLGKKIIKEKVEIPIIDFGLQRVLKGSKMHAFIKGLVDSELKIKYNEKFFPSQERIKGEHLEGKIPFEEIKLKIEKEK